MTQTQNHCEFSTTACLAASVAIFVKTQCKYWVYFQRSGFCFFLQWKFVGSFAFHHCITWTPSGLHWASKHNGFLVYCFESLCEDSQFFHYTVINLLCLTIILLQFLSNACTFESHHTGLLAITTSISLSTCSFVILLWGTKVSIAL